MGNLEINLNRSSCSIQISRDVAQSGFVGTERLREGNVGNVEEFDVNFIFRFACAGIELTF